jgi:ferredoxin
MGAVTLTAADVKAKARELGADLCNVVACATLEVNPPDPGWPQVPSRISKRMKTCIITAIRMPWGMFLTENSTCLSLAAQLLLRKTEKVSLELSYWLEAQGHYAYQVATEETDPALKRGSYGWLSLRHVAVEAGMGTLGLEVNILTPEFGPRVYNGAVLTEAELEPDARLTDQLCIGETCGRCLLACPPNAVLHWGLDKRKCALAAQPDGISSIVYGPLRELVHAQTDDEVRRVAAGPVMRKKWSALVRLSNSYAACPRCLEVCPVGGDYQQFLAREHKEIPEKDAERTRKLQDMKEAVRAGDRAHYATPMDKRWIGEDGYKGLKRLPLVTADHPRRHA